MVVCSKESIQRAREDVNPGCWEHGQLEAGFCYVVSPCDQAMVDDVNELR